MNKPVEADSAHAMVDVDAMGVPTLFLRGAWSDTVVEALKREDWEGLAIFGVDWTSYAPLVPFADRITRLRVPFGPDESAGLDALHRLQVLQVTDVLSPAVDYRRLRGLRELETIWHKRDAQHLAHPGLQRLRLHKAAGPDLRWIPDGSALEVLDLRGGALASLAGIERARHLRELRVEDLRRCGDLGGVATLAMLEVLELDCRKASLDDIGWIAAMPRLRRVMIGCPVARIDWSMLAAHPALESVAITAAAGFSATDADIVGALHAGGRAPSGFKRYPSKPPAFAMEFKRRQGA